jgi:superfamily II DNA/RNA helicase
VKIEIYITYFTLNFTESKMSAKLVESLNKTYQELASHEFVIGNTKKMKEWETLLNSSLGITPEQEYLVQSVRSAIRNSHSLVFSYSGQTNYNILLTQDGLAIARHFHIPKQYLIIWNNEEKNYSIILKDRPTYSTRGRGGRGGRGRGGYNVYHARGNYTGKKDELDKEVFNEDEDNEWDNTEKLNEYVSKAIIEEKKHEEKKPDDKKSEEKKPDDKKIEKKDDKIEKKEEKKEEKIEKKDDKKDKKEDKKEDKKPEKDDKKDKKDKKPEKGKTLKVDDDCLDDIEDTNDDMNEDENIEDVDPDLLDE